jgi:predicted RecA/RadA family phage recombinase
MNNFIGAGGNVTVVMPYARTVGQVAKVGSIIGVSYNTYASGATGVLTRTGIFTNLAKASGATEVWAQGDVLYWDDSAKNLTKNSTGNTRAGTVIDALGTGGTGVTVSGQVLLAPTNGA